MAFEQMDKNTVDARNQLGDTELVRFFNLGAPGKRILLVGNSITLHGKAPQIGWHGEWGMAASAAQKDYAHLLMGAFPEAPFCICQVAAWEREYRDGERHFADFQKAQDFSADVIVCRFVENCPKKDFDPLLFQQAVKKLLAFLDPAGSAQLLFTTGFWQHPADETILALARQWGAPCVWLGDLGQDPAMRGDGLFANSGVAHHPGDQGMAAIAERIRVALHQFIPKGS